MKTHTDERNLEMLVLSSKLSSKLFKQQVPEPSHQAQIRNPRSAESDHLTIDLYSKQTQSSIPFTFFSPFPHTLPPLNVPKVAILMQLLCFEKQYPKQVGCSMKLIVIKRPNCVE